MRIKIFFTSIVLLALCLRLFQINNVPKTLYGDEQAFAWNAYSILKTGQDEYGTSYPLQFRSFEDYKAPIPVYLLVPFINTFGLNTFGVRLPITIASVLTIIASYALFRIFFNKKACLIAMFLFAISPWHIHLSRGFFESTLSLLFFVVGVCVYLKHPKNLKYILIGSIFYAAALYSYFTPRIYIPIILIALWAYLFFIYKDLRKLIFKNIIIGLIFLIIITTPLIKESIFNQGLSRMNKLISTNEPKIIEIVNRERNASNLPGTMMKRAFHNKATGWTQYIATNYMELLSTNYLFLTGDTSLRYFIGNMGMLYLIELPLFLIGAFFMIQKKPMGALFFFAWMAIMAIPASIAGKPFAVRSLSMLPAPFAFIAYGMYSMINMLKLGKKRIIVCFLLTFGFILSLGFVLLRYYFEYPVYAATWWGWENKAALDFAQVREKQYDKIFLSDFYTGMPLAFAVYNNVDPKEYKKAINNKVVLADGRHFVQFGKYYIGSLDIDKSRLQKGIIPPNSLYIARPEEANSSITINAPDDGRLIYKIYLGGK